MRILLLCVLLLFNCAVLAQLNESDTLRWQFRSTLTGTFQQGNVDLLAARLRADLTTGAVQHWVYKTQNAGLYQAFYKKKADLDLFSRHYIYYKPFRRAYPFGLFYLSTNYRRKINGRYFLGGGYTVQLMKKGGAIIKLSGSLVYEQTRFAGKQFNRPEWNNTSLLSLWRATVYSSGSFHLSQNGWRIYYEFFFQPGLSEKRNHRWQAESGIEFPLRKGFSFNLNYLLSYEDVVITGVRQRDALLSFGVGYQVKHK